MSWPEFRKSRLSRSSRASRATVNDLATSRTEVGTIPQVMVFSSHNTKGLLLKIPYRFIRGFQFSLPGSSTEPAMNGTSGFQQDAQKGRQQGRIKRRGDAYSVRYGEPLSEVRTPLAGFFSVLLEVRSSTSQHQRIGSRTGNGINSEQAPGTFFVPTILSLSPQASTQRKNRFLTPFLLSCLVVAMFLLPTDRWISLPISDAIAAESDLARQSGHWDNFFEPCILPIKSADKLYRPRGPIPEPGPFVIGCNLVDCGPGTNGPGPIDLRITLTGDLAEKAILEFENMTVRDAARIGVRGNARHVAGTTRFEVRSGITVLRGFAPNPELRPPVAIPHLTLNRKALEALKQAGKNDDLFVNSKSPVTFDIEQFRGQVNVNGYAVRYEFRICPRPPETYPEQPDRVEFSNGIPSGEVLILAPGRVGTQPWGCVDYEDEVYPSSATAVIPVNNHLEDELNPEELGALARRVETGFGIFRRCHSEVVVYGKSNALAVVHPVTPPWTDPVGDKVPVSLLNPLQMPVTVWILLADDKNKSIETKLVAQLESATSIYTNAMCGITFDNALTIHSVNTDLPTGHEQEYLRFDPSLGPSIMTEGCINPGSGKPCFYTPNSLNVYLVEYIDGNLGFTSYSPTFGTCARTDIPTCDFFGDMIFLVESRQDDTIAHEFGHTLELDGINGILNSSSENLMFEGKRSANSITKGQCYRVNVDHFSYANTGNIRPAGSSTHGNCPRDGGPSNVCPELLFNR